MKRIRLSTLLLLVAIAALAIALVEAHRRAALREVALRAEITLMEQKLEDHFISLKWNEKNQRRIGRMRAIGQSTESPFVGGVSERGADGDVKEGAVHDR